MLKTFTFGAALALTASAARAATLEEMLRAVGELERAHAAAPPCRFTETTTLVELGRDGRELGRETRVYDVVRQGDRIVQHELKSTVASGAELSRPLRNGASTSSQRPHPSPFRPESQRDYVFTLAPASAVGRVRIAFEPKERATERSRGEAELDDRGRIAWLRLSPSKLPMFLDALDLRFTRAETACGDSPVRVEASGVGGFAFYKIRFRSETSLEGFHPAETASAR